MHIFPGTAVFKGSQGRTDGKPKYRISDFDIISTTAGFNLTSSNTEHNDMITTKGIEGPHRLSNLLLVGGRISTWLSGLSTRNRLLGAGKFNSGRMQTIAHHFE